jgi:hypothetical protein
VAAAWFPDPSGAVGALVRTSPSAIPDPGRQAAYAAAHAAYRQLYPALAPFHHSSEAVQA